MSTRTPERPPPYDGAVDHIIDLETTVTSAPPQHTTSATDLTASRERQTIKWIEQY
jgi:hypothetical protein